MSSDATTRPVEVDGATVPHVIEPETVDELRVYLAAAERDEMRVLVVGGSTRLAFGNCADPFDVAISTQRLNRVIHYEPDDMTLAVEPGCTIAQIAQTLAENNQFIALDVAHAGTATIAGSYSTGMSGPRRLGGGSLKDWVIGVEVASTSGVVAKAGGMVVKNVTGFDMMHLHYGALGAFGVVTRLNLKVFPAMRASRSVALAFDHPVAAHAAGIALLRSQLQPASILVANDDGWLLHVRCDAPESAIGRVVDRVVSVASDGSSPVGVEVSDDPSRALAPFTTVTDLSASRGVARLPITASRQAPVLDVLATSEQLVCADLGSGLIYVAARASAGWVREMRELAPATFLALPADLKRGLDVFGPLDAAAGEVVARLKASFDPQSRLNSGRFVNAL